MKYAICRMTILLIMVVSELGYFIYEFHNNWSDPSRASYVAHFGGLITGLLLGVVILRNLKVKSWERIAWWICLVTYLLLIAICILINIFYEDHYLPELYGHSGEILL